MRYLRCGFFLLVLFNACPGYTQPSRKIDVLNYVYSIELSDKTDSIKGEALITFRALDTLSRVNFDLAGINTEKKRNVGP